MKASSTCPFAERVAGLGTENAFKIGADIQRAEAQGTRVIRLNLGEPDFNSAEHINRVAIEQINAGNSHYTDPQGILPLRRVVSRHLAATRGIDVGPERIVVTAGAKPPISYTMLTYVNPGDEVIYPSPGFPIYESWVTFLGAVPVPLHLDEDKGFRFDASDVERLLTPKTKVLIVNSPSNPTGGVLTAEDLGEIAEVIREKATPDIRIYSDEVYEDIIFEGRRHVSIASMPGMEEKTIVVSGHSKSYAMTGWRLGYAVLPTADEADVFRQFNINIVSCIPPFIQEAGREALENPASQEVVDHMVHQFEVRRDVVVDGLNSIDGVHCALPQGAFYAFPNITGVCERLGVIDAFDRLPAERRAKTSPATLFQMFALYRHGVATMDRRSFGAIGSEGKHYLRLSTAASVETLTQGVQRIEAAVRDAEGFAKFMASAEESA